MNQPQRKRRFFSFSLRTLLIAMLLFGCLFGWVGLRYRRAKEQRAILDKIKASGGTVYVGRKGICNPTDRELFFDGDYLGRIERVEYPLVFNQGSFASPIPDFGGYVPPEIPDTDISPLAKLKNLQELSFEFAVVSDLAPLAGLENLQKLDLSSTEVTDLTPLVGMKNLQELDLSRTDVTDLSPLAELKNLQYLEIDYTPAVEVTPLAGLKNLETLDLAGTKVTDLGPLARLKNLKTLNLVGSQVTDLSPLVGLKNLEKLLLGKRVDDEEVERLKKALPNCDIMFFL